MDTYPCPSCGGPADADRGCSRCGHPHDPDAAAFALYQRTVAALESKQRKLTKEQLVVAKQLAHASAQRDTLRRRMREQLGGPDAKGGRRPLLGRLRRGGAAAPEPAHPGPASPGAAPRVAEPPGAAPRVAERSGAGPSAEPGGAAARATRPTAPPTVAEPAMTMSPTPRTTPAPRPAPAGPPGSRRFSPVAPPDARTAPPGGPAGQTRPVEPAGGRPGQTTARAGTAGAGTLTADRRGVPVVVPTTRGARGGPRARSRPGPARQVSGRVGGAEATTRSMQTGVLALGGLMLAAAAVTVTVIAFTPGGGPARMVPLTVLTLVLLALPVLLARRGLTATGETVAAVALLLVLLDGYVAWLVGLFGAAMMPRSVYFGLICLITAGIALAYQATSHLIAPRYAALLVVQPVLPLLAYEWVRSPAGWAFVLCGVALIDLAFGWALSTRAPITVNLATPTPAPEATAEAPADPPTDPAADPPAGSRVTVDPSLADPTIGAALIEDAPTDPPESGRLSRGILPDVAWTLFALAYGAALAYAASALIRAEGLPATIRAAAVVLLAATVGVAGSLVWRRRPMPDLAAGIATLAFVYAAARVAAVALPGYTLLVTAGAVTVAALVVPLLPARMQRGPRRADTFAAALTGLALIATALPVIVAPIRGVTPVWRADVAEYDAIVQAAAGPGGWQLFAAALLLTLAAGLVTPRQWRSDAVVIGLAVSGLVGPAAVALGWLLTPAVAVLSGVAFGVVALIVRHPRTAWLCLGAATVLGTYATAVSLASPAATAVTLTAITIAGAVIGASPRAARTDPQAELVAQRVTDAAAGGALFALPGAAAAGAAVAVYGSRTGAPAVLVASFLALAVALGVAALIQVARQRQSAPLLIGAALGVAIVVVATLWAPDRTLWDLAVALLMVLSVGLLWSAPAIDDRQTSGSSLTGADTAAAAVTVAGIAAVSRAVTLVVPGSELITVAVLVLVTAVGTRALLRTWRPGPVAGGTVVGAAAALWAGGYALAGGAGVIAAATPFWEAPLGEWQEVATRYADYDWQVPGALLVLAAAGALALAEPRRDEATAATIALAAIGAPVALDLGWTAPMLLGWATATGLGVAATMSRSERSAYTRIAVGIAVGLFTAGAGLVRPSATAGTLLGLALSSVLIAVLAALVAARRRKNPEGARRPGDATATARRDQAPYLTAVGGAATTGALLAFTGACAVITAAAGHSPETRVSATLAACALGLAAASVLCRRMPGYLPYVTAGVATGATIAALATVPTTLPAAVYAGTAALIGVLAELIRAGSRQVGSQPTRVLAPGRTDRTAGAWRRPDDGGYGYGMALAAGVAAAVAVVSVAPAVVAALIGPYRWLQRPWTGDPSNGSDLGMFQSWIAGGTDVLAAFILTVAAALAAIGLGGDRETLASRAVAVIVPGLAMTVLIAPPALGMPWPAQPTAGLLVATVAGLGLALTVPPPQSATESALRDARRLVFVIAILGAGAGGAGSLATRSQTIAWLAGSVVVGLVAALRGRTGVARVIGWQVAASTALLLALASVLATGRGLPETSFAVLLVAAVLLGVAALLPRVHRTETTAREITTIEAVGYVGCLAAVAVTFGQSARMAAALFAIGAVLGIAAARPGRSGRERTYLIVAASLAELFAIWVLLLNVQVAAIEAYTLPFAALALITGIIQLKFRPEIGSWLAYGPALVVAFAPTLALVLLTDASEQRRVLLIAGAVLTVAVGADRRQKAPVMVGGVVTAVATLHEFVLFGRTLDWPVLLVLFAGAGALLIGLGARYERRRSNVRRLRGVYSQLR
ncbi:MAG TPA: permease [Micromonosporaceae bacterium]|nr:permease [Micromonosporaceae bacterium]